MKEYSKSMLQALYGSFPEAYFLIETVMHRASSRDWGNIIEKMNVVDEERLDRAIRSQIQAADLNRLGIDAGRKEFSARYPQNHKFNCYKYKQVVAELSPSVFICRNCGYVRSLKREIESNKLSKDDLICPNCHIAMKQIIHIFGHPICGSIEEISPENCRTCGKPLKLQLDNISFGRSRWQCSNGHSFSLVKFCALCKAQGQDGSRTRMVPYAAAEAIKPVKITKVDISTATDWEDVVSRRLRIKETSLKEKILENYKDDDIALDAIKRQLNADETTRHRIYEQFLKKFPDSKHVGEIIRETIGGEPKENIRQSLGEYHGTEQAVSKSPKNPLDSGLAKLILKKFSITARYISNLPILQMVYGYQVGTSDPEKGKIRTFDRGLESVVLTHRLETEAALFDLDPERVVVWLNNRLGINIDEGELYKMLLRPEISEEAQSVYDVIVALLHTMSHLLIRQSELFTGLSRESLSEMIFPTAMAFAIYCEQGSELGALNSTFASYRLFEWLNQARTASRECAHDPVCSEAKITSTAACHACLYISERRCNGYWNESLDRRLVSDIRSGNGYWD